MKILDIGCGKNFQYGKHKSFEKNENYEITSLDRVKGNNIDVVWDLEKTPLPFKKNEFDMIVARHIIEHIFNFWPLMNELHRILKQNGMLRIWVPHYSSFVSYINPEHIRHFSISSFNYFSPDYDDFIAKVRFKINKKRIHYVPEHADNKFMKFLDKIFNPLINIHQVGYEKFLAGILSSDEIYFELQKV